MSSAALPSLLRQPPALLSSPLHRLALFLDYDGTLTPIVSDPQLARISPQRKETLERLGARHLLSIVTGRSISTIRDFLGIESFYYAGSHGFDIRAPGFRSLKSVADDFLPELQQAVAHVQQHLAQLPGAQIEDNKYSVSIHYRNLLNPEDKERLEQLVDECVSASQQKLAKKGGKMLFELRPNIEWNKGKAIEFLLENMEELKGVSRDLIVPIVIGDDLTDEDGFKTLANDQNAVTVLVLANNHRPTAAKYTLNDVDEVHQFLHSLSKSE